MAPALSDSIHPAADPVLAPLLSAKTLRRPSGSYVAMAPKPALASRDPEGLRYERVIAIAFGAVLDELKIANTVVADYWSVSESVVRGVRSRNRPLSYAKVLKLPQDLRDALDRKTRELMALNDSLPALPELLGSRPSNDHFNR